jgi:nicotinamidase-related amidase
MLRGFSRRQLMFGVLAGLGWQGAIAAAVIANPVPFLLPRPLQLGTTFSQLQCRYLGVDVRSTFRQISGLGFDRIRLCAYWNELEPTPGQFDFSTLDWLLEESHRSGLEVVLAIGMKAPRWPEFHFPDWITAQYDTTGKQAPMDQNRAIADRTLTYITAVMEHTRHAANLRYWQVENEPLTRLDITAGRWLSDAFVREEVSLVRRLALPGQQVVLTTAIDLPGGNKPEDEHAFQLSQSLADGVGLNIYTQVPSWQKSFYLKPLPSYWQTVRRWQQQLHQNHKASWIAEAQAEPWEPDQLVPTKRLDHPSSSPWQATRLARFLGGMGYETVMLWGCEYWYWQRQQGRDDWWQAIEQLIDAA